jgi:uncharacterized protein YbcI
VSTEPPGLEDARGEIAREIARVHEESYGTSAVNLDVAINERFVAIYFDIELSRAEQTLVEAGNGDSVRQTRESYQEAIGPTFSAIVERATGRRVIGFASRAVIAGDASWAVEAFRLGRSAEFA